MSLQVLFIEGGGEGGHQADEALVTSLRTSLGNEYDVSYPEMQSDESAADFGWTKQIGGQIAKLKGEFILVGHSLGASLILKYLSENPISENLKGLFLIATPFWTGDEDWKQGFKLQRNFAEKLPDVPMFFYHCNDDEEVPISHMDYYRRQLAQATFRVLKDGGHQLNSDLTPVANDVTSLKNFGNS